MENPFIPRTPHPLQAVFLTLPYLESLYGGAAGGGKSVALLMAALQYVQTPGYAALLLRRSFSDLNLAEALIPLSHEWLQGSGALWNGQDHKWSFPSGASLSFGYLATEADKFRYKSSAFQFIGFDELTQFSETQYRYLFSRLRRKEGMQVPLRMRGASNPGDIGHEWVKKRFLRADPSEGRIFIPAKIADNPHLDAVEYEKSLAQLDPITRAQLRDGDWDALAANVFKPEWIRRWKRDADYENYLLGDSGRIVRIVDCQRFAVMDVAGTEKRKADAGHDPDFSVLQVWDLTSSYDLILVEQWRGQLETPEVEDKAIEYCRRFDVPYLLVESNGIGLGVVQSLRRRGIAVRGINARKSGGDKLARSQTAQIRMEAGTVYFPEDAPWLEDLEAELRGFPVVQHDDQVDTLSYAALHTQRIGGALRTGQDDEADKRSSGQIAERQQEELEQQRRENYDPEEMWEQ
jgi:predicted phage terminase large subunit-like protein